MRKGVGLSSNNVDMGIFDVENRSGLFNGIMFYRVYNIRLQ
jgi:hypothetical protein